MVDIIEVGHFILDKLWTPERAPFMTLTVSDMKASALLKSKPLFCSDSLRAWKMFDAVPIFTYPGILCVHSPHHGQRLSLK